MIALVGGSAVLAAFIWLIASTSGEDALDRRFDRWARGLFALGMGLVASSINPSWVSALAIQLVMLRGVVAPDYWAAIQARRSAERIAI